MSSSEVSLDPQGGAVQVNNNHLQPVSEALTPIFNQLQTVQRCLKEVLKFGIGSPRDLYPYSMKVCILALCLCVPG